MRIEFCLIISYWYSVDASLHWRYSNKTVSKSRSVIRRRLWTSSWHMVSSLHGFRNGYRRLLVWATFGGWLFKRRRSSCAYHRTSRSHSKTHCFCWTLLKGIFQQKRYTVKWLLMALLFIISRDKPRFYCFLILFELIKKQIHL